MAAASAAAPVDSGDKKYKVPGSTASVDVVTFQEYINRYVEKADPGLNGVILPMKDGSKDMEGVKVYKCFGAYRSDTFCIKCPIRKGCLSYVGK